MLMRRKYRNSNENGASMVEILCVLAFVGIVTLGALAAYSKIMSKFKTTQAINQAQHVMKSLSTYFAAYRQYPVISAEKIYRLGFLGDESYDATNHSTMHPFGGLITFSTADDGKMYSFQYDTLPVSACVAMATMDINVTNLYSITVGTAAAHLYPDTGVDYDASRHLPYDVGAAITDCATEGKIKWTFL
jgi:type II secretory pathway pseudopilin PulG